MKNIIILLVVLLSSCRIHEYPTFPILDGKYIVRSITIYRSIENPQMLDTTLYDGLFQHKNPIGGLDSLHINQTEISFSGNRLYIYQEDFDFRITQDFLTRKWVFLNVDYYVGNYYELRRYTILEDGVEYIVLELPKTGQTDYPYSIYLVRTGP